MSILQTIVPSSLSEHDFSATRIAPKPDLPASQGLQKTLCSLNGDDTLDAYPTLKAPMRTFALRAAYLTTERGDGSICPHVN